MKMATFKMGAQFAAAVILFAGFGGAVFAQAVDAIAARQAIMKSAGPSLGAVRTAAGTGDMAAAKAEAQKLSDGFKSFGALFPAGSDISAGKTRAKPEIWTDAEGFKAANDKAVAAADSLLLATGGTDTAAVMAALTSLQQTCGGCHSVYRGPPIG